MILLGLYVDHLEDSSIADDSTTSPGTCLKVGAVFEGDIPSAISDSPRGGDETEEVGEEPSSLRTKEERKLAIMTMNKRRKRLFDQIMKSRNKKMKEVKELKRKRKDYEDSLENSNSKRTKV